MTNAPQQTEARARLLLARMALAAGALTFVVIVASAFMRHTQAGLACADWPACYGRMQASDAEAVPSTEVRVARIAHRLAATGVLALVIGLLLVAWTQKPAWRREGALALAALIVAAALAVLGLATPGSRTPAVTLGNLLGGYLMLALLAATAAAAGNHGEVAPTAKSPGTAPRWLACVVIVLAFVQAAAGGMIGAQYALPACPAFDACPDFSFGDLVAAGALDPFRPLSVVDGRVVPPSDVAGLHALHRALGIAVAIATFAVAYRVRRLDRRAAWVLVVLVGAAPLLGAAAIAGMPTLPMTVLHNASAALLIAALAYVTLAAPPRAQTASHLRR